jgi:hypothetical protein
MSTKLTQDVIRAESVTLIRYEVLAAEQRARLEMAVRDAIVKLGCSVEDISEASGLTPTEIRRLLAAVPPMDEEIAVPTGSR